MTGIYRIGTRGRSQAAVTQDGRWFTRELLTTPWGKRWTPWRAVPRRPDHAWYDPAAGQARLPLFPGDFDEDRSDRGGS